MKHTMVLLTFAALVTLIGGCGSNSAQEQPTSEVTVAVAAVEFAPVMRPLHTSGRLSIGTEMNLSFKTGGVIDGFRVEEGERVKRGQVLASLKLAEISAQVEMAESARDKAQRDLERARSLYADSVATLEQLQNAETAATVAAANVEIARFNLDHSVIRAPADGIVLRQFAEANELVATGRPVVLLGTTGESGIVKCGVADRDVIRLALGDSAEVSFDVYPGQPVAGEILEIAESPDPRSGVYEVEVAIAPCKMRLLSGFSSRVTIYPKPEGPCFIVPVDALVQANRSEGSVFTVDADSRVHLRRVEIAFILGERVALRSGLEGVDRVVTRGAAYIADGDRVRIGESIVAGEER